MPIEAVEASATVFAEAVSFEYWRASHRWRTVGETVRFEGRFLRDGSGYAGESLWIFLMGVGPVAEVITAADGTFFYDWVVPFSLEGTPLPCEDWPFNVYHYTSGVRSADLLFAVAYVANITIVAPSSVISGAPFDVTGVLTHQGAGGVWYPLAGRQVIIYYDGTEFGRITTGGDGSYVVTGSIPISGTFTLRASYAGELFPGSLRIGAFEISQSTLLLGLIIVAGLGIAYYTR